MRWAALLRGVNVGGHRKLPMADLRAFLVGQGFGKIETLLASGNAIFTTDGDDATLEARLERAAREVLGLEIEWLLRDHADLAAIIATNPFQDEAVARPAQIHVLFHRDPFPAAALAALVHDGPERLAAVGRELFIDFPLGAGRSTLGPAMARARFPRTATARNWNTVTKLAALAAD